MTSNRVFGLFCHFSVKQIFTFPTHFEGCSGSFSTSFLALFELIELFAILQCFPHDLFDLIIWVFTGLLVYMQHSSSRWSIQIQAQFSTYVFPGRIFLILGRFCARSGKWTNCECGIRPRIWLFLCGKPLLPNLLRYTFGYTFQRARNHRSYFVPILRSCRCYFLCFNWTWFYSWIWADFPVFSRISHTFLADF